MRITVPRALAGIFLGLLGCYAFLWAPELTAAGAPESRWTYVPPPQPVAQPFFPPAGRTFIGVQTRAGVNDFGDEAQFATATGTQPQVYEFAQGWAVDRFDATTFTKVAARGMLPLMSWEPWDYRTAAQHGRRSEQPDFRLSTITNGGFDPYLRSWAEGIAALRFPVGIRLAHEMNGNWYPWSESANGNGPGDYVRMWRHVHDAFAAAGATNVIWVWSPNVVDITSTPLPGLYPGDGYVDWIGVSGYYGTGGERSYRPFEAIFGSTLRQLAALSGRPVVITEVGATDAVGRRAEWIGQMFASLAAHPEVIGLIWFEVDNEVDWRIGGAPDAAHAFGVGAGTDRYATPWSPYTRPLLTTTGAG